MALSRGEGVAEFGGFVAQVGDLTFFVLLLIRFGPAVLISGLVLE